VIAQPNETRLFAGMELDRPRGTGHRIGRFAALDHVIVDQHLAADDLSSLAHADLNAGVVDEGIFAPFQAVAEEARVFADLPAALDFRFGEVFDPQRLSSRPSRPITRVQLHNSSPGRGVNILARGRLYSRLLCRLRIICVTSSPRMLSGPKRAR